MQSVKTTMGKDETPDGFARVFEALDYGGALYVDPVYDFNAACDHIVALLTDAVALFDRGSYGTSCFIAITALEETAKAHVGLYRRDKPEKSEGRDPFRNHQAKHSMASLPAIYMGSRLTKALGAEVCQRLEAEARAGFVATREACLYMERKDGAFITPAMAIGKIRARELVLLAIEAADDALVGYSNHSYASSEALARLFGRIASVGATR
jgi:AbiV family abortive infection protein